MQNLEYLNFSETSEMYGTMYQPIICVILNNMCIK